MKLRITFAALASVGATAAQAGTPLLPLRSIIASVDADYLSYSGAYGHRQTVNADTRFNRGPTKFSFGISQGSRSADGETFHAAQVEASVAHDWTSRLTTRTSAGLASDKPVFVNRELAQDVSYKLLPNTVVTAGGKYARYYGGVDVTSWSLGASEYFRGGYVSYRFSDFHTEGLGNSIGHLVSFKLSDPFGATQAWVGHGTAINDAEWLPTPQRGTYTSAEVQRSLPLGGGVALGVGVKQSWYRTPAAKFNGTGVRVGLTFNQ